MPQPSRRRFLALAATAPLAGLFGCRGAPTLFGYRLGAGALYDESITTVYVPVFHNRAFQTTPFRGFEADVTEAVVREIGRTTTFRVCSDPARADTELLGNIVAIGKSIVNRTQQNTVRDGDVVVTVEVVWRDLRDGTILSARVRPRRPGGSTEPAAGDPPPVPFDPTVAPVPARTEVPPPAPAVVVAVGRFLPELGETNASASKRVHDQIAVQIVSLMEKKW